MKKIYLLLSFFLLASMGLFGQVTSPLSQTVAPKGGVNALALEYFKINFTKEQRNRLKEKEIEFIYQIDPLGKPTLEAIKGITDRDILDSLEKRTSSLPQFQPQISAGVPQSALYFVKLTFPTYQPWRGNSPALLYQMYPRAQPEDFEYLHKSNKRIDVMLGGMSNQFWGSPADYLRTGGGMKVDLTYTAKNQIIYGMVMNIYGNKMKKPYPLPVLREQFPAPPTMLLGGIIGRWFGKVGLQAEIAMAVQNITERQSDKDPEWVQLTGWSPGLVMNIPVKLGKDHIAYYDISPSITNTYLNFHVGVRPLFLSLREASGIMTEVGVSFRLTSHLLRDYKLKPEFFDR
jgi:hypothetical protein